MNLTLFLYIFVYFNEVSGASAGGGGKGNEICMFCLLKSILPLTSFSVHLFCLFDVMPCIISKMKILEFL